MAKSSRKNGAGRSKQSLQAAPFTQAAAGPIALLQSTKVRHSQQNGQFASAGQGQKRCEGKWIKMFF